jgi:hypothetical protein
MARFPHLRLSDVLGRHQFGRAIADSFVILTFSHFDLDLNGLEPAKGNVMLQWRQPLICSLDGRCP